MTLTRRDLRSLPSKRASGDDSEWGRWIPSMWHALADPDGVHPWPDAPQPNGEPFDGQEAPAWWVPTLHLLRYSLGWTDPGVGLRWWYDAGRPVSDRRFRLIKEMLGDRVDDLAAFFWLREPDRFAIDQVWLEQVQKRGGSWSPCVGGSDPMHFETHSATPDEDYDTGEAPLLLEDPAKLRAVIVVDQYAGWHHNLVRQVDKLTPSYSTAAWRVDVVCRAVCGLGTYRYSRSTGEWFSGPHRFHTPGCPPTPELAVEGSFAPGPGSE